MPNIFVFFFFFTTFSSNLQIHATESPRPRGIFIQVSSAHTWVLPNLERWLQNVCNRNKQLQGNNTMNDLVLQDVATERSDGSLEMRYDVLDKVLPFAPGGSRACFGNLFVGTVQLNYTKKGLGGGSEYVEGIMNPAYRKMNLDASLYVAKEFMRRYSKSGFHWYLTYEANLNFLGNSGVKDGYKTYFKDLIRGLTLLRSGVAVMWSPTFWNGFNSAESSKIGGNLVDLFRTLKDQAPPGITWMNLQDSVGKHNDAPDCIKMTTADAVGWYNFVRKLHPFSSMQMNVELFKTLSDCNSIKENDAWRQIQNERYYAEHGVNMGASFEIRYWREREGR